MTTKQTEIMENDFDYIDDEKSRRIIELLTPKHLNHTMKLKKVPRKNTGFMKWSRISAVAAVTVIVLLTGVYLMQPETAQAMPSTSKEILACAIRAIRNSGSISLEFDAYINSADPDGVVCSPSGALTRCRYRCLQSEDETIQRVDFDFDSIEVCNIYVNDSVYMWKGKELLYKGIKENPTGLKGLIKLENVLERYADYNDIEIRNGECTTTLRHESRIEGGTLIIEGEFDNRTGLIKSCRNMYVYNGTAYPIVESRRMELDIPISREELLMTP